MDKVWLDAAHAYSRMSEADRVAYWNRLDSEQQGLLQLALAQRSASGSAPIKPAKRSGCLRTGSIGCLGVIVGIVFTIAAEIILINAGVDALTKSSVGTTINDPMPAECRGTQGASFSQLPEPCQQWILRHQDE